MTKPTTCKHGYLKYQCGECDPLPLAAEIIQELITATERLEGGRGCSSRCGATCYCGARGDRRNAESRMSWAVVNAHSWAKSFKQREIKSVHHEF